MRLTPNSTQKLTPLTVRAAQFPLRIITRSARGNTLSGGPAFRVI